MKLAIVFRSAPHGCVAVREGVDVLLSATAFCEPEELGVFFLDDGVFNLIANQQPEILLQKNYIPTFKLLDLYEIKQRFVCQQSLTQLQKPTEWIISATIVERSLLIEKLNQAEKILTF